MDVPRLGPGDLVANRFEVEAIAGTGGMATVYRAVDRHSNERVALKVMHAIEGMVVERFAREADVLSGLSHPAIVRYVARGTSRGQEYIAMEWLEGEDLARRLVRAPLSLEETLGFGAAVARALAAAHAHGVVHRDVKPSNLFLVDRDVRRIKLVDFGVARFDLGLLPSHLTATGVVLGTPSYMAPEQARASKNIDGRADVFALACVLFKCLCGRPPFVAKNMVAVLAKILLDEPPRLGELSDAVPAALEDLIGRMLSKEPRDRPDDEAVAEELEQLRAHAQPSSVPRAPESYSALGGGEQRVWSVVLIGRASSTPEDPTLDEHTQPGAGETATTLVALRAAAARHAAHLETLADGSMLATIEATGADVAARAARCALALHALLPASPMALATGRAEAHGRLPIGDVTDRAARMLERAQGRGVRIDDATAGLFDARFEVTGDASGLELRGEREAVEQPRTLLGRNTPCVGRERELGVLQGIVEECFAEPVARCVLVTGPAGIGKSRLLHELMPRLLSRGAVVWSGRADVMSRGSMLGLIAPSIQREAGVVEGESHELRQRKLAARVARHVPGPMRARVTAFLGDLIGAQFPEDYTPERRAALEDVVLRGDHIRRAWMDFLQAELAAAPVVLMLENLQWGDVASVKLVDLALRNARAQPWLVVATARPEVKQAFPELWTEHGVLELRLEELRPRASERLVRAVLGDAPSGELVGRMVERAAGNAFYLEEIIRAVAKGHGAEALPDTVLAMVQSRLDVIDGELRRVLRAASLFGHVFWEGGVAALLGAASAPAVPQRLAELEQLEIVYRAGPGKFPGEPDWAFRQAVVRDAAYAMLTEADRTLGHRVAAKWLEQAGEREPMVLAEHWERGAEEGRAIDLYYAAAMQGLGGNDFAGALERAERGVRCGAAGAQLGMLRLVQAEVHKWRGEYPEMNARASEAKRVLPPATDAWYSALALIAVAVGSMGDVPALVAASEPLFAARPASHTQAAAWDRVAAHLATVSRLDLARPLWDALEGAASVLDSPWIHRSRAFRALFEGDPAGYAECSIAAAEAFAKTGDIRNACQQRSNAGDAIKELGDLTTARSLLRQALDEAERMGLAYVATHAKVNLASVLARTGEAAEAVRMATQAVSEGRAQNHGRFEAAGRVFLALAHLRAGDLEAGERAARDAAAFARASVPPWVPFALAAQAALELALGRVDAGLGSAREAHDRFRALGALEEGEGFVRLVYAEALEASGDRAASAAAIAEATGALRARAERIRHPAYRRTFLESIAEHAQTLELARAWAAC